MDPHNDFDKYDIAPTILDCGHPIEGDAKVWCPECGTRRMVRAFPGHRDELLAALNDIKCRLRAWMMADDAGSADAVELLTDLSADVEDAIAKVKVEGK